MTVGTEEVNVAEDDKHTGSGALDALEPLTRRQPASLETVLRRPGRNGQADRSDSR
jgi:hypothetical protein